jgi:glyoxylase-like metal-dependent hydrolase (beta-lactamase superfamily II)
MTAVDDTYTGHVEPHTAARRTLPEASIVKVSVGPMDNNAYLVSCSRTGQTLLIDAANEAPVLTGLIEEHAPTLAQIVTTHQHQDHWIALEDVAKTTGAPTAAHRLDADALPVTPDRLLADGDRLEVGDLEFDVIHLRGHTPGAVALALRGADTGEDGDERVHLFTGDSLFPGGPGRTGNAEDFASLMGDLETKIFDRFGDTTVVYPGHGDDTTLGAERPHLGEWRERGW